MPKGFQKGYQNSHRPIEEIVKAKPAETRLHGTVARIPNLYKVWDDRLHELNWNWSTLGRRVAYTRQYVVDLTDRDEIPMEVFLRICKALGLDPHTVIEPVTIA